MQQNCVCKPFSTSTSSHMSANQTAVALYPVVVYTRLVEGGPVVKLAWAFVSMDLKHDFFQVTSMIGKKVIFQET